MYCPICFNDTLKIASSGVVKMTFNGKAKSTSQFFYDLKHDQEKDVLLKLDKVIADYFIYYSSFQNQDPIETVEATSIDFKCLNKCVINVSHKMNVIGLVFTKTMLIDSLNRMSVKYKIPLKLKFK
ncbi:MAG: hypothetical protein CME65_01415 [Halobacteriovoraceae bacterium]|nr:hypothetical protein [Halobacteriovoraceae bacterium]|tara:strand:- start:746 stop:1123 length:378 start_codon:yes stop_codon:yes gene_type:complete